jgi:hypothetical protein
MKTSIISLALGIVLAGPVAAYATEPASGSAPSNQATDLWNRIGDFFAAPTTSARANAHAADPFKPRTTDGLSSSRDACASYGCVDAGGGGD